MSVPPQPIRRFPSTRLGTLPAIGTVSMWPATTTRSAWGLRKVRATTLLPWRSTVRWGSRRSAASISSARAFSSPLSEAMSTNSAVSAFTS